MLANKTDKLEHKVDGFIHSGARILSHATTTIEILGIHTEKFFEEFNDGYLYNQINKIFQNFSLDCDSETCQLDYAVGLGCERTLDGEISLKIAAHTIDTTKVVSIAKPFTFVQYNTAKTELCFWKYVGPEMFVFDTEQKCQIRANIVPMRARFSPLFVYSQSKTTAPTCQERYRMQDLFQIGECKLKQKVAPADIIQVSI
jgi:hypothetical protein